MFDGARDRANVCRRDAKPRWLAGEVDDGTGDGGLLTPLPGGDDGVRDGPVGVTGFFLPVPNERRNDHSDSNCIDSNSVESGE